MYALHVSFPIWPLSIWGVIFVKISVALMLLRIKQTKTWRIGMAALIGSLVVVGIVATILQILQCRPIQAYWDFTIEAHCMSPKFIHASSYIYNSLYPPPFFIGWAIF